MIEKISPDVSQKIRNMSFICACLVVFIHSPAVVGDGFGRFFWEATYGGINNIAVPFFFLVSGFMLAGHMRETGWWKRGVQSRLRTLVLPYVLCSTIYAAFSTFLAIAANLYGHEPLLRNVPFASVSGLCSVYGLDVFNLPFHGPLWFIRTLFLLVCGSFMLMPVIRKKGRMLALLVVLFLLCATQRLWGEALLAERATLFDYMLSPRGAFYFCLGVGLRFYPMTVPCPRWGKQLLVFISLLLASALTYGKIEGVSSWAICLFSTVAVPVWMYTVWEWTPSSRWPHYLTNASFTTYVFHIFILNKIAILMKNIPALQCWDGTLTAYIMAGTVSVIGSVVVSSMLEKWCPRTRALLFGGR